MTTTVVSSEPVVPVRDPFRALSIAADLLPAEIVAARNLRRYRGIVISGLVVVLLAVAGWYGVVRYQVVSSRDTLNGVQNDVSRLTRRQNSYADLIKAQTESEVIKRRLGALLAEDLPWSKLLSSVQLAAPRGVKITGMNGTLASAAGAAGATGSKGGVTLPNATGEKIIGSLSVTGIGDDKSLVAAYVDAVGNLRGLGNPLLGDVSTQEGKLRFTVKLDITRAALGGRFTTESGEASGDQPSGGDSAGGQ